MDVRTYTYAKPLPSDGAQSCPKKSKQKPTTVHRPSDDVSIITRETEQYKCLSECGIRYYSGKLMLCTEVGELIQRHAALHENGLTAISGAKV